jgi:hypothetical protein
MNTHPDDASAALASIQIRQAQVIRAVQIPFWYWWAVAAGMVIIGAAVDTRRPLVLGIVIPIAAISLAGLTVAMILGTGRGVRLKSDELLGRRGALLIVGFVWLIIAITLGLGFGLQAAGAPEPATISTAAGGLLLALTGPSLTNRLNQIMLGNRAGLTSRTGLGNPEQVQ